MQKKLIFASSFSGAPATTIGLAKKGGGIQTSATTNATLYFRADCKRWYKGVFPPEMTRSHEKFKKLLAFPRLF